MSRYGTYEPLDNHAANLLFRFRQQLEPIPLERGLLIRSMINEGNERVPGWHWLKDDGDENVEFTIQVIALHDPVPAFRAAALKFLARRPPITRSRISDSELADTVLSDPSDDVVAAAVEYTKVYGTEAQLEKLSSLKERESSIPTSTVETAIQLIQLRSGAEDAVSRILTSPAPVAHEVLAYLESNPERVAIQYLRQALTHSGNRMRAFAAGQLIARGALREDEAHGLLTDSSLAVRAVAIRRLIALGSPLDPEKIRELLKGAKPEQSGLVFALSREGVDPDDLVFELFETYRYEDLEAKVDWFSLDGPIAYRVLACRHFERWVTTLRTDLANRFLALRERSTRKRRDVYGELVDRILEGWAVPNLDSFIEALFAGAALKGIAYHGSSDDVILARPYVDSKWGETQSAAVSVISKFGDQSDVELLVAAAKKLHGSDAQAAARAALNLCGDRWQLSCRFLRDGTSGLVKAAIEKLMEDPTISRWNELEPLLYEKSADIRRGMLRVFTSSLGVVELQDLLSRYVGSGETYYYDVVASLDRFLHAPTVWRSLPSH
jgi:hypothetical protein